MALQVNDAVHVASARDNRQLEGVVAFLGSVEFADGDDWVGVRLTGASVGLGKNDGSVKGVSYFASPINCGMFVRMAAVTKRSLTRLEELRLRRELATAAPAAASGTTTAAAPSAAAAPTASTTPPRSRASATSSVASTTPPRSRATTPRPKSKSPTPSTTPPRPRVPQTSTKTKLEELRLRRAALAEKKEAPPAAAAASPAKQKTPVPSPAKAPVPAPTKASAAPSKPDLQPAVAKLQSQVQELEKKLRGKEQDASALQTKLSQSEQEAHDARARIDELQEAAAAVVPPPPVVQAAAAAVPAVAAVLPPESHDECEKNLQDAQAKLDACQDKLDDTLLEITNVKRDLEREKDSGLAQLDNLTKARSEVTLLQKELQAVADQTANRGASDTSHYKERAKLLAEISALKRKAEQAEKDRFELEAAVEEVALDKEQLEEEKEALEDQFEELKLDAETAQMEVEELRMELEDTQASAERAAGFHDEAVGAGGDGSGGEQKAEELAEVLSVQNARLREALIRLREQSSVEKMEVSRQLRTAEKDAEAGRSLSAEVDSLRTMKATLEEQISDLKDMVEQGAAFEEMVEDLSDRLLSMEEDNIGLQSLLREMEEAAELTAEMEEVQADELKEMSRDLEGRDTIIRNLEEAIKMQRRREADFQRTLGNYRTTVDTLRLEKQALLEIQQGGEGEKSSLLASSQKALARAAQLVSDAAAMRKRDAEAVMNQIDYEVNRHLSRRLESLLPQGVVAPEVSAMKGELMVAKTIGKASKSLEGIAMSFSETIRPGLAEIDEADAASAPSTLQLSDNTKQEAATMLHQTEFAHLVVEASSDLLRFLSAGQWPDVLTHENSMELGSMLGHSISDLEGALSFALKSMKEEGVLTPEQSSIGSLKQTIETTMQNLRADIEREDGTLLPSSWNPPGWQLLKDASIAKFTCMGAAASLSLVVNEVGSSSTPPGLVTLYNRLEQAAAQAVNVCLRLSNLDVNDDTLVGALSSAAAEWKEKAAGALSAIQNLLRGEGDMQSCVAITDDCVKDVLRLSSVLRSANLAPNEDETFHALSPETTDVWDRVSSLSRHVRAIDGDEEDVNYLLRARAIEYQLGEAVENEPKLALATAKVASLEKNISSRSKEIAMQNARLSELEKLLAKSSASPLGRGKASDLKSSEEFNSLKEENRVLMEAMDVMQRQVDEYEDEIRVLKDFKSPKRGGGNRTPRRSLTSVADLSSPRASGGTEEMQVSSGALEAALFRPALQNALQEAAHWKATATASSILNLPPLPVVSPASTASTTGRSDEAFNSLQQLSSALSSYRLEKASVKIVDLTNRNKSPRVQLREISARKAAAAERLETIVLRSRGRTQQ